MSLDARIDVTAFDKALKLVPKVLKWELRDSLDHIQRSFLKKFRLERLQGPPGIRGGGPEGKGPGIFNRFKKRKIKDKDIEGMGVEIYTQSKIAKLHEAGGTVTAKGGKLAVPFSQKIRPQMYTGKGRLKSRFRHPGQLKNVGLIVSNGKELLVKFLKRGRQIRPLYILKREVILKPQLGFYKTWESHKTRQLAILNSAIHKALKKA